MSPAVERAVRTLGWPQVDSYATVAKRYNLLARNPRNPNVAARIVRFKQGRRYRVVELYHSPYAQSRGRLLRVLLENEANGLYAWISPEYIFPFAEQ